MAFKMKGYSPFTAKKTRKVSGKRPKNAPHLPDMHGPDNVQHNSMLMKKDPSAMKLKTVPAIPRKGKKSPADRVTALIAKEEAGTLTNKEKRELRRLRRFMETGPGSYGREEYDKE